MTSTSQERHTQFEKEVKKNGNSNNHSEKGTTAEWTESKRVLDDGELGLETTTSGHRIIRIGNGSTEFMSLPVAFDIEEVREIKTGMDKDAKRTMTTWSKRERSCLQK